MKALVIDARDGKKFWGELISVPQSVESAFNIEHSDLLAIGAKGREVMIPFLAARVRIGVDSCPDDAENCD